MRRIKASNAVSDKAERNAKFFDNNTVEISGALDKAKAQRAIASAHTAKSHLIREKAVARLNDLEKTRGSSTARNLADRLSRL